MDERIRVKNQNQSVGEGHRRDCMQGARLRKVCGKEIKNGIIVLTYILFFAVFFLFFFFIVGNNNPISLELTKNHKDFHFNRPESNFAI